MDSLLGRGTDADGAVGGLSAAPLLLTPARREGSPASLAIDLGCVSTVDALQHLPEDQMSLR